MHKLRPMKPKPNPLTLSAHWREKAARLREQWKHHMPTANAAMHAAAAFEIAAEDLENFVKDYCGQCPEVK
jgi:hypothetical protein